MRRTQRFGFALTLLNLAILIFLAVQNRKAEAQSAAPVLRARALEIVDDHGKVRASIKVYPEDPKVKMPDGTTGYPETVMLRLISSKGRPNVKIAATEDGSAQVLGGESDPAYVQILARGNNTSLKLINKDGREQVIKP